jgi:hypothetical protein
LPVAPTTATLNPISNPAENNRTMAADLRCQTVHYKADYHKGWVP